MKIKVHGPIKLSGEVDVQGSKNSAMKTLFLPMLNPGKYEIKNVPDISSIHKLTEVLKLQGAKIKFENNLLAIDTTKTLESNVIPAENFYHTSGCTVAIPVICSRFGKCSIEKDPSRDDVGGDQIGSRFLEDFNEVLMNIGFEVNDSPKTYEYTLKHQDPFEYDVKNLLTTSTAVLFSAITRNGTSRIKRFSVVKEAFDVLRAVKAMGVTCEYDDNGDLLVYGGGKLNEFVFTNEADRHDFVSLVVAALSTESEITIKHFINIDDGASDFINHIKKMGVEFEYDQKKGVMNVLKNKISDLNPIDIISFVDPYFASEWHVLMSPLLSQMNEDLRIAELAYSNRLEHWEELEKMGVNYEKLIRWSDPDHVIAINISGGNKLKGTKVVAKNVRAAAALLLAGLAADGETIIDQGEELLRAYDDLHGRLNSLGAEIELID